MIAIVDYGMGNLRSVAKAVEKTGADAVVTQKASVIQQASKVILPGVGAIKPAVKKLKALEVLPAIYEGIEANKPFLGICLGFQLLFETSDEGGDVKGLGILKGNVTRFTNLKVPHMGWNQLHFKKEDCPLWQGVDANTNVYFCHSYYAKTQEQDIISATTDYGLEFCCAVSKGNVFGVQFHPEKSQNVGLKILENFVKI